MNFTGQIFRRAELEGEMDELIQVSAEIEWEPGDKSVGIGRGYVMVAVCRLDTFEPLKTTKEEDNELFNQFQGW